MDKRIITQKNLINEIASELDVSKRLVKEILNTLETLIYTEIASTTPEESVEIKVLHGLRIISEYQKERVARNPRQNNILIRVPPKRKISAKVTLALKKIANEE